MSSLPLASRTCGLLEIAYILMLVGCSTIPYTDRSQLLMVSLDDELALGTAAYQERLRTERIVHDPQQVAVVNRVANRIILAALRSQFVDLANRFAWEVNVVENAEPNAYVLSGGKIMVHTGILPIVDNDDGLAIVLGHEVAHALARHGAERITQALLVEAGLMVGEVALLLTADNVKDQENRRLLMGAIGLGAQYGLLLPYSRKHESEADYIGLLLAAQAGYNPREAIRVWERMARQASGEPLEFLSTHPNAETRIQQFEAWMPEAERLYVQTHPPEVHSNNKDLTVASVQSQAPPRSSIKPTPNWLLFKAPQITVANVSAETKLGLVNAKRAFIDVDSNMTRTRSSISHPKEYQKFLSEVRAIVSEEAEKRQLELVVGLNEGEDLSIVASPQVERLIVHSQYVDLTSAVAKEFMVRQHANGSITSMSKAASSRQKQRSRSPKP